MRAERIIHPLTAEEAFRLDPSEHWELVAGRIVTLNPTRPLHGKVLTRLARRLGDFVELHDLGEVYSGDVGFILERDPDTVRAPDLAFIRKDRLPSREPEGFSEVVPDLAVEIVSPSDRWVDIEQKVTEYLHAGVLAIWAIEPTSRTARVYRPAEPPEVLAPSASLVEPEILPGFRLDLADLLR